MKYNYFWLNIIFLKLKYNTVEKFESLRISHHEINDDCINFIGKAKKKKKKQFEIKF